MHSQRYTVRDATGALLQVDFRRDKRLKRTSRWERLPDGSLLVRVPYRFPRYRVNSLLEQIAKQAGRAQHAQSVRIRRTDTDLQERAELVNRKYFNGKIQWNAIRWVSNMDARLGSCTKGGTTDGQIRLSDKIKHWPDWVIDYVIAHELMHRTHPNHSPAFWSELRAAFPLAERARGFIAGVGFAKG
jgi:predicted metal-dependent hydrolase